MAEKASAIQVVNIWIGTKHNLSHETWKGLANSGKLTKDHAASILEGLRMLKDAKNDGQRDRAKTEIHIRVGKVVPGYNYDAGMGEAVPIEETVFEEPNAGAKTKKPSAPKPSKPVWEVGDLTPYEVDGVTYEPSMFDIKKTFGIKMLNGQHMVMGFKTPTDFTPEIDPAYVFDNDCTSKIIMSLTSGKPMLLYGETGTGKTTHIEQVCARINYDLIRFNHHRDIIKEDIVGQLKVKDRETYFELGPLPWAMPRPMVYLMDEFDTITAESAFVYQPVLEQKPNGRLGSLIIGTNGKAPVHSGQHFRMLACGNTAGLGDETAMYTGTQMQNVAFVGRFRIRAKLDYLNAKTEKNILLRQFPILKGNDFIKQAVETANMIRERYKAGELVAAFSVRDLINWVDIMMQLDGKPQEAMCIAFSDVLPFQDAKTVEELVQRNFSGKEIMPWV